MIRVLIERHFAEGMDEQLRKGKLEVRQQALRNPGYISGESLRNASDPLHNIVISTWRSRPDWEAWLNSQARREHLEKIDMTLTEPEKITILEPL